MTKFKTFSNYLNSSKFIRTLLIAVQPIYAKQMRELLNNDEKDFESYGTDKEKYLKSIMAIVHTLQSYFEDLEKVIIFLKVDKSKISNLYDKHLAIDDYYKYHYDNFIIRIVTSIDVCGKIGNLVFDLKIQEKKANWHSFANSPAMKETEPSIKLLAFSDFIERFKGMRHTKVHAGHNPQNRFDTIIFWEVLNQLIDKEEDEHIKVLKEHTQIQIQEALGEIEEVTSETARHTFEFLDTMTYHLEQIIKN